MNQTVLNEMNARLSRLKTKRTSLASINQLPSEVLCIIIYHVIEPSIQIWETRYKKLHNLAQVCKQWATIIKGTPSFWAELDGSFDQAQ